jgi:serine protease Do
MRGAASRLLLAGFALAMCAAEAPGREGREGPVTALADDIARARNRAFTRLVQVERASAAPAGASAEPIRLLGTGIAIGGSRILTTAGVVGPAEEVGISHRGRSYRARVIGVDRRTNVALLEIPGLVLPAMPVAADAMLFSGDLVVAVGIGPKSGPQASFGVVVVADGPSLGYGGVEVVQTTAPGYLGLSGGVLINPQGEMVGMVSGMMEMTADAAVLPAGASIVSGTLQQGSLVTSTVQSATVAVPARAALDIADELGRNGRVERGFIGLQVELVNVHLRQRSRSFPGVLIQHAVTGGPAERAGLLSGDVILEYASSKVESPDALSQLVAATLPGVTVPVLYLRRGAMSLASVRIAAAPEPAWDPGADRLIAAGAFATRPASVR